MSSTLASFKQLGAEGLPRKLSSTFSGVGFDPSITELFLGSPAFVQENWNVISGLLHSPGDRKQFLVNLHALAEVCVMALRDASLDQQAVEILREIAGSRLTWPEMRSLSPALEKNAQQTLLKVGLGVHFDLSSIRKPIGIPKALSLGLVEDLRRKEKRAISQANGTREYWEYHYIAEKLPPFLESNLNIWQQLVKEHMDLTMGTLSKRIAVVRRQAAMLKRNPMKVGKGAGVAGKSIASLNRLHAKKSYAGDWVRYYLESLGLSDDDRTFYETHTRPLRTRKQVARNILEIEAAAPCVLSSPEVAAMFEIRKTLIADPNSRYEQLWKDVKRALREIVRGKTRTS